MAKDTRNWSGSAYYTVLWILLLWRRSSVSVTCCKHRSSYQCHTSALVRPWMDNGNALAYVKKNDRHVKYKGLVRYVIHLSWKSLHSVVDYWHCGRDWGPSFHESSNYPWGFERSSYCVVYGSFEECWFFSQKKILIGPQDQPLITDYTLAEARHVNLLVHELLYPVILVWWRPSPANSRYLGQL